MKNKFLLLILGLCFFFTACKDEVPFEPELVVLPETLFTFEEEGGDRDLTVQSNVDWTIISQPDWVTTVLTQGDYEYGVVKVSVQPNESYDSREGKIVFRSSEYSVSDTVHISQAQKDAIIVTQDSYNISGDGGELTFSISSNVDFNIAIGGSWIKRIDSRALTDTVVTFEIYPNIEKSPRSGTIYLDYRDMSRKIIVNQTGFDDNKEHNALVALYHATGGDNWINNTNWCSDKPLNEWYGVRLDKRNRVYYLRLDDNNLIGSLPAELGNLTNLQELGLYNNQLSGSIPTELGNLTNLTSLILSSNQLSGFIPTELCNLTNLTALSLNSNQLSGIIPSALGNLTNLAYLYLFDNQLSGVIPSALGNLTNLTYLYLFANQLSGSIPEFIGNIESYKNVILYNNYFDGELPSKVTAHKDWHIYWPLLVCNTKVNLNNTKINGPEFTVTDLDGNTITSDELYERNKVTVLYQWGKWCEIGRAHV